MLDFQLDCVKAAANSTAPYATGLAPLAADLVANQFDWTLKPLHVDWLKKLAGPAAL